MSFHEAVIELLQHPGSLAILGAERVLAFNTTGYLQMLQGSRPTYARLRTQDFIAMDWQVMSPEQLEERARQNAQGA